MADPLQLADMLNEHWLEAIGDLIRAQPDAAKFLGPTRDAATIPERTLTFTSLNQLPPKDINVIIFGQDPYPRAESAIGVAFNDGAIRQWNDKYPPSFANLIKNVLYGYGMISTDQGIADVRKILAAKAIAPPPAWFKHTIQNGVCWLNTSLTFTSTDLSVLAVHLKFWKPIIEGIISALIDAKRELKATNPDVGLVFVMWGGHAQKLQKLIEKINQSKSPQIKLEFVTASHPAANGNTFHGTKTFASINSALESLNLPVINWLPSSTGEDVTSASSSASSSAPSATTAPKKAAAKKVTATKKLTAAKKAAAVEESDDSEEEPVVKKTKKATASKKASGKKATASKKRSHDDSDEDDDYSVEEEKAPTKKRAKK